MQKFLKPARPDLKVHNPATKLFLKKRGADDCTDNILA